MDAKLIFLVCLSAASNCNGASFREHPVPIGRRFMPKDASVILGAPSYPSHLPAAEPILPGHTLIRPSLGMLKSALKFPHRELENGAGVYGNIDNLGITYDGRNERVLYSGFRRMPTNLVMPSSTKILAYFPNGRVHEEPKRNMKSKLTNRLHTSAETLYFVEKLLRKLRSLSNQRRQKANVISQGTKSKSNDDDGYENVEYQEPQLDGKLLRARLTSVPKRQNFDNLKVNLLAPNLEDFIPRDAFGDDLRNWWYYHQADYKPFNDY